MQTFKIHLPFSTVVDITLWRTRNIFMYFFDDERLTFFRWYYDNMYSMFIEVLASTKSFRADFTEHTEV